MLTGLGATALLSRYTITADASCGNTAVLRLAEALVGLAFAIAASAVLSAVWVWPYCSWGSLIAHE
ncbi:hypothetical protein ABZ915_39950 [Streptomyces sp. NPDC046915]|uniref:hypothetical protein n=1 Tax=Streptomyces sp. NPDC046915 TaxID=3155257 RepID=UPI0033C6E2BD